LTEARLPSLEAIVAGHICVDLIPAFAAEARIEAGKLFEVGPLRAAAGGCVANTGLALAQLGASSRLVADIGNDDLAGLLRLALEAEGSDISGVRRVEGGDTSYSIVIQPPGRDRTFWHHPGANAHFDGTDFDLSVGSLLHVGYPPILPALWEDAGAPLGALFKRARAAGMTTSLDMCGVDAESPASQVDWSAFLLNVLPLTDVFVPSLDDMAGAMPGRNLATLAGIRDLGSWLIDAGAAVVMLKAGEAGQYLRTGGSDRLADAGSALTGARALWANRELWFPSLSVAVASTTGSGDAAAAGLIFGLLRDMGPEQALATAAGAAASRVESGRRVSRWASLKDRLDAGWERNPADIVDGWDAGPNGALHGPADHPAKSSG
jgi:sugar/nucleoside kinase (ribokinase family)